MRFLVALALLAVGVTYLDQFEGEEQ